MVLHGSSTGSLIDRIGAVLQAKARSSESPPMMPSPTLTSSPESRTEIPEFTANHPVDPSPAREQVKAEPRVHSELEHVLSLPFSLSMPNPAIPYTASSLPGKRPASPEETQIKRARLSPESSLSIRTDADSNPTTAEPSPSQPRDEHVFCYVPGRLALLNNNTKYPVTVNEIKRRLGAPERLNASILGGVLRRAKSKNGGKELRDQLDTIGLDLPAGKRKAFNMTLFTAIVEGEALHLAKDFDFICESEFPIESLVEHNAADLKVKDAEKRKRDLEGTMSILGELMSTLSQDRAPLMNTEPAPILPAAVQDGLTHFSQCTHGFGTPALLAAINTVVRYSEKALSSLTAEARRPQPVPSARPPAAVTMPTPGAPMQPHDWQNFLNLAALFQMQQQHAATVAK